jgi:uncharacterized membrane protein
MSTEHFHPMVVHFPIVFLFLAPLIQCVRLFVTKDYHLEKVLLGVLSVGLFSFLIAVLLGEEALGVLRYSGQVAKTLAEHEDNAIICFVSYLVSLALVWPEILRPKALLPIIDHKVYPFLILFIMILGLTYLIFTSHTGGQLVYIHGLGVSK